MVQAHPGGGPGPLWVRVWLLQVPLWSFPLCRGTAAKVWAEPPPQQCPSTPGAALPDPCPGGWDSLDVPNDFGIDPQRERCEELESFNLLLFSPALCEMRLFLC